MNLYLMGYRGSGKSRVAELLAAELRWPWIDADARLEERAGRTIREIFAQQGETAFRDLESEVLAELAGRRQWIVALGGGAVLRETNRKLIQESGKTVWLRATPETLWRRIGADPTTSERRPNLTVAGGLEEVRQVLAQRTPIYDECADLTIDTEDKPADEVAREIARWLAATEQEAKSV